MINKAMQKDKEGLTIGVLDIYGFEIFMVSKGVYKCSLNISQEHVCM